MKHLASLLDVRTLCRLEVHCGKPADGGTITIQSRLLTCPVCIARLSGAVRPTFVSLADGAQRRGNTFA